MITGLAKLQTGLRVDRILFKQFQELCGREKLRPGEAVESLMRTAVKAGSISRLALDVQSGEERFLRLQEISFKSRLARLHSSLEADRKIIVKTGRRTGWSDTEALLSELLEMASRITDEKLLGELEKLMDNADKLYALELSKSTEDRLREVEEGS